jgi:hypothetical protein
MRLPEVDNPVFDKAHNIAYHVMAYRKLTPDELRMALGVYQQQRKRRPKKNSRVTIISTIE